MSRPVNRAEPRIGAENMQTFAIRQPKSTHFRKATCEEVECQMYAKGWKMVIDLQTPLGQKQAGYIKHQSGRQYQVAEQKDGLVTLVFAPNQPCFQDHQVRTELPEIYLVKGGDFRGNPRGTKTRVHSKAEHWVEEFAENQDRIIEAHRKG